MTHVFFDLDGTLTDPAVGITNSVMYALSHYGIPLPEREALYPFIGPPLVDSFQKYYGFSEERAYEATKIFQEYFSRRGLFENEPYRGVPEMLSALRGAGKRIVLATSKPEVFAERILEHFHLLDRFDFVCGAELDEKTRFRKEDILRYALQKSGASPEDSVMVGDRLFDVLGAKQNKMASLGVLYGYGSREELEEAGADRICKSISECKEILLQWS